MARAPFFVVGMVLLAALGAEQAAAEPHFAMRWDDCFGSGSDSAGAFFDCAGNDSAELLVVSLSTDSVIDSVIGMEFVIDLQATTMALPDWWAFQPGGCRAGALTAEAALPGVGCVNLWGTAGVALVQDYQPGEPRGGANQARIRPVVAVVPADSARTLQPGVHYAALGLRISHVLTNGVGACTGCATPVCLVLNSITVRRLPGSSGDLTVTTPAVAGANQIGWQSAVFDCSAVPVERTTWGRLKGLYR